MPTYEYECKECGHAFERFQSINDDPIRTCPECEGRVRRLISTGGGLVFKGPGFYATDYRRGPRPTEKQEKKESSSGSSKGDESKKGSGDGGD
jgi:putative FmdB family regulatory protein